MSDNAKVVIQKNLIKNELEKIGNEYEEKKKKKKIEILIENSKNNFLKLKYNNKERPLYNNLYIIKKMKNLFQIIKL